MRPLPPPCLAEVTVLVPSAIRPRTSSEETFYFLGARSPLGNGLFLVDCFLELVPMAPSSVSFLFAAWSLIVALLFASSISEKQTDKFTIKTIQLNVRVDGLTLTGALLVFNGHRSGFRFITIPVDGIEVDELSPGPFLWFRLRKFFFKKDVLLNINLGTPSYCKK